MQRTGIREWQQHFQRGLPLQSTVCASVRVCIASVCVMCVCAVCVCVVCGRVCERVRILCGVEVCVEVCGVEVCDIEVRGIGTHAGASKKLTDPRAAASTRAFAGSMRVLGLYEDRGNAAAVTAEEVGTAGPHEFWSGITQSDTGY
jgi:hypothetical protein